MGSNIFGSFGVRQFFILTVSIFVVYVENRLLWSFNFKTIQKKNVVSAAVVLYGHATVWEVRCVTNQRRLLGRPGIRLSENGIEATT